MRGGRSQLEGACCPSATVRRAGQTPGLVMTRVGWRAGGGGRKVGVGGRSWSRAAGLQGPGQSGFKFLICHFLTGF